MEFEDFLSRVGSYGKFQKLLLTFFILPVAFLMSWVWFSVVFMTTTPDHWCRVPEVIDANLSTEQRRLLVSNPQDPFCSMYDRNYSALLGYEGITMENHTDVISCQHGWDYDKSDWDATLATKWDLVCDKSHYTSMIISLQSAGGVIGTSLYGGLSDRFGRKKVFLLLAIVIAVAETFSMLIDDFRIFGALRFLYGSAFPFLFTLSYILIVEFVAPEKRGHVNGIMNCVWSIGICTMPLVAYFCTHWMFLSGINCLVSIVVLLPWKFVPESPSWLLSRGRYQEAADVLVKIGNVNGNPQKPDVLLEDLKKFGEMNKKKDEKSQQNSCTTMFQYSRLRKHFFMLTFCWTANGVAYLGLTFNTTNLYGNQYINFFLLSVVEGPGCLVFWIAMDRLGRRWTSTIGFFLIGLACLLPVTNIPHIDIVSSMIGKFLVSGNFMVTDQQGSELYPTVSRSFCMGFSGTVSKTLTFMVPYLAYMSVYSKLIPFLTISGMCFCAALLASFLPETLNQNLPQTVPDADLLGRKQKYFSWIRTTKPTTSSPP